MISTVLMSTQELRAEEADSLKYYDIDDVVVIGMKEQAPLHTLPMSATTINLQQIERHQIIGIKDFVGIIPNFMMLDRDTPLTSSVFVRGTGSLLSSPIVMYVDGIPHFEKSSFDLNLNDVEKIDFLRGPQGTLFGRNAMGGTVLIQTRSPFRYQGTNLSLRYGSYNELVAKASHLGKINDHWAYSIAGSYRHFGGFIPNTFLNEMSDKANNGSVNAKIEWRPSASSVLRFTNNFDYVHQGAYTYGVVDPETMYVNAVSLDHPSVYIRRLYDAGLQFTHHARHFLLRSQLSMQILDGNYDVDQDGSKEFVYNAIRAERQHLYSGEISLIGNSTGWYNWSVGAFTFFNDMDRIADLDMAASHTHRLQDEHAWGIALFHQSTFNLNRHWNVDAGIRYDVESNGQDYTVNVTPKGKPTQRTAKDYNQIKFSQITPKLTIQYLINPTAHWYATVSRGYVTGGFNPAYENGGERTYGPEHSWSYEVGAKGWIIPRRLYAELALFAIDTQDKHVKKILDGQAINTYNAGRTMSKGLEVTLNAQLTDTWDVNASYGLTHATFIDYVYSSTVNYTGNFVPLVPRNTVSVNTQYRLPIKGSAIVDGLTFRVGYKGIGDIYWKEDNNAKQKYYGLLDASITASKGRFSYSIWGTNLTDTKYLGYYYSSMKKNFGKPGRPLMAGVKVNYSF